jgi:outer membrane receptor protein involved in Fe transport
MKHFYLCCLLLSSLGVFGQQTLIGKVVNVNQQVIDYVNVINIQTGEHAHTDTKGQFTLEGNRIGDTLEISRLAYKNLQVVLTKSSFKEEQNFQLESNNFDISEILVNNDVQSLKVITDISLETNPVNSAQELLRQVPGLVIGQHAGGGKAEQIFLRGFDIDHGTDIRISTDGMPVNMVSHAHGQGYADLHFIIPETVKNIDFGKGPYYTQQGNFATAGYVDFQTKEVLDYSSVGIEYGSFNTMRIKGLFNLLKKVAKHDAYIAASYNLSDGPFESSQHFNRINLFGKYTGHLPKGDKVSLQAGYFYSKWDASGQIPVRVVESGLIGRFGSIDDTEGGQTSRANVLFEHTKLLSDHASIQSKVYYSNYNFELYSNFTFFNRDSIHGDQIKQFEQRNLFGGQTELNHIWSWDKVELQLKGGLGFRYDDSNNNELSHTKNRQEVLEYLKLGNIDETNIAAWVDGNLTLSKWRFNLGTRIDYFRFNYVDLLDSVYSLQAVDQVIVSPKLNIMYSPNKTLQFYLKTGIGFHSNDTRVVVAEKTARTLPAAYGADLGVLWKPLSRLVFDAAVWTLFSEQEMVYVGDEAIVEPSGSSFRLGVDLGAHYQILDWLYLDANATYAYARSVEEPEGANYFPLAPNWTSSGGISIQHPIGLNAGLRYRYIHDRPANEDNTILATGYGVFDFNASYQWRAFKFGLVIQNLFNAEWNETQFATESRLRGEATSVEEIHFTPGAPFGIRGQIEYRF